MDTKYVITFMTLNTFTFAAGAGIDHGDVTLFTGARRFAVYSCALCTEVITR